MIENAEKVVFVPNRDIRGACAGIRGGDARVIERVAQFGKVYLNHVASHYDPQNKEFAKLGVTVEPDASKIPQGSYVMGSPHGSSPQTRWEYVQRGLIYEDLECPLVTYPKDEVREYIEDCLDRDAEPKVGYIGHKDHQETDEFMKEFGIFTTLLEDPQDLDLIELKHDQDLFIAWQTTLAEIESFLEVGHKKFPGKVKLPRADNRCGATRNRQRWSQISINDLGIDLALIITSLKSSNGTRLVELAEKHQPPIQVLTVMTAKELQGIDLSDFYKIGINAAASVPPQRVDEVITSVASRGHRVEEVFVAREAAKFRDPIVYSLDNPPRPPLY